MKGYTQKAQPTEGAPVMIIGTIANGANPDEFLEAEALKTKDDSSNADGDLPNFTLPPFANGTDNRNRG